MDTLNLTLTQIAVERSEIDQLSKQMDAMLNQVRWSPEYIELETKRQLARSQLKVNEDLARELAIQVYNETKVKKMPGIMVKEFSTWQVKYDMNKAVTWIEKKAKYLYVIDWQRFEKEALASRETLPFPCVEYVHNVEVKAQIASNLAEFVREAEPELPF